ncbi:MAG: DUF4007 family protein [Deltaproteobacteria bacterium]|nr:DUF4007 family protein [Deltaproteobacteria bacterium]
MVRGPLFQDTYRPQFSGHETFPLRYGWLKKAFDRVAATEHQFKNRGACWGEDAIAWFGVGKNMVASMRHWAKVAGVIDEPSNSSVRTTDLGQLLFGPAGLDLYMEHPATLWLIHWQLAAHDEKTTWFWAFNHYPAVTFERASLIKRLERLAMERQWSRAASTTIRNDVTCFIRTYAARQPSDKAGHDDALESPLTELGLIRAVGQRDGFRFVRGPKTTLGDGVFTYALLDFWSRYSKAASLSFEAIAHAPGGPGRVFLFDENDVVDRLAALDGATGGALQWSETAGIKQVERNFDIGETSALSWIPNDYRASAERKAA